MPAASVLETEKRVVSPMKTTGSGLHYVTVGYPVSDGIIDSIGGRIGYRPAPIGGAIFYCDLPAASE
jgi:K+-sensing histidine kinase KdpD